MNRRGHADPNPNPNPKSLVSNFIPFDSLNEKLACTTADIEQTKRPQHRCTAVSSYTHTRCVLGRMLGPYCCLTEVQFCFDIPLKNSPSAAAQEEGS